MLSERDGLMHRIGKTVVCPLLSSDQLASHSKRDKSLDDRRVVVVDGTGLSMPDTPENQSRWPQSHRQKPGCGFPTARMLGLFDLSTGGHIAHHLGNKHTSELAALRHLWSACLLYTSPSPRDA